MAAREQESTADNNSILALVEHICSVHDVDLRAVTFIDSRENDEETTLSILDEDFEEASRAQWMKRHGWDELQLVMLNEALMIAEALPSEHAWVEFCHDDVYLFIDYPQLILYALSALKSMHSVLEADDQYHCYTVSARAFATARRRGDDRKVEHWSGNPLIDIEVLP